MYMKLAANLKLPDDASTQKLAFLGVSGSGKTYGAGKFVEELLANDEQVVIIDTIGNWWGLRLAADGKEEGFDLPILGGVRGDVELHPTAGEIVADTVASTRESLIVDVSDFTKGELRRFVTAFATRLLKAKKAAPSPTMIVWEECQSVIPQRFLGEAAQMVGAVEDLVKKGRNYGVGTTLISQRPQAVNKDVLNQCETLFVFRMGAKLERKAINEWVVEQGIDVAEAFQVLPKLPTGECFVWSPNWLQRFERVKIAEKVTFDASKTPKFRGKAKKVELPKIDLEALKATMADAIESTKMNDPSKLKQEIARLDKELTEQNKLFVDLEKKLHVANAQLLSKAESNNVRGRLLHEELEKQLKRAEKVAEKIQKPLSIITVGFNDLQREVVELTNKIVAARRPALVAPVLKTFPEIGKYQHLVQTGRTSSNGERSNAPRAPRLRTTEDKGLGKCAREILVALARRHPTPLSRVQAATLAGYSHTSGGYATSLAELNVGEYIVKHGTDLALSEKGLQALPNDALQPFTGKDLLALWLPKVKSAGKLLRVLFEHPEGLDRTRLAEMVNLSATSGGYATYLAKLNVNALIVKEGGLIKAAPEFFQ